MKITPSNSSGTDSLRFAHLTDIHLREAIPGTSPVGRRRSRGALARLALALDKIRAAGAEFLAVTGDLIDAPGFWTEGMPRGFFQPGAEEWREWVLQDYRAIKRLLDEADLPYCVLPGNHDAVSEFHEVFGATAEMSCRGFRIILFEDYEQAGHVPRRFVPARSHFDAVLSDDNPAPQIHLQHYLLQHVPGQTYPHTYAEYLVLRRWIAGSGKVRLSLSGHYHRGTPIEEISGTTYTATPSFCDAPHRWRIIDLSGGSIAIQEESLAGLAQPRPAVFLDRDGVINDEPSYSWGPERFHLIPEAAQAIRELNLRQIPVIVATSQSAVGYGFVPVAVVQAVHERMHALLAKEGAFVDAVYFTTSAGERSIMPELGQGPTEKCALLERAAAELGIDPGRSWMVGDRITDMDAAAHVGAKGIHVQTGYGANCADLVRRKYPETTMVRDLAEAVEKILMDAG